MKTKTKEVDVEVLSEQIFQNENGIRYGYRIQSKEKINTFKAKLVYEYDEPETIGEFIDMHGLPKKELLKWLNKNYK